MASLKVGLTGGLAAGKSTVARLLRERGLIVVDADRLVAELYGPAQPGAEAVVRLFGRGYLDNNGAVDRPRLASLVFSDESVRRQLEAAIHPLVRARFAELADKTEGVAVLEATLLVEAGYAPDFDLVVTVEAPIELRLQRAIERGLSETEARARLEAQGDGAARREAAHRVIENQGGVAELEAEVDRLIRALREAPARPDLGGQSGP